MEAQISIDFASVDPCASETSEQHEEVQVQVIG
jgi:hypothetical protein